MSGTDAMRAAKIVMELIRDDALVIPDDGRCWSWEASAEGKIAAALASQNPPQGCETALEEFCAAHPQPSIGDAWREAWRAALASVREPVAPVFGPDFDRDEHEAWVRKEADKLGQKPQKKREPRPAEFSAQVPDVDHGFYWARVPGDEPLPARLFTAAGGQQWCQLLGYRWRKASGFEYGAKIPEPGAGAAVEGQLDHIRMILENWSHDEGDLRKRLKNIAAEIEPVVDAYRAARGEGESCTD